MKKLLPSRLLRSRASLWLAAALLAPALLAGCAASERHAPAPASIRRVQDASGAMLEAAYNQQARAIRSLSATVRMTPVAGSASSGVIEDYHEVGGFILMAKPALIRVIGQAPVVATDVFDMVSDGRIFRIFIPSKNQFLVGPTTLERVTKDPIENMRPQHILEAFFWPELPAGSQVLFEQFDALPEHYYILTVLRPAAPGVLGDFEIGRKIWFDRTNLRVARLQIYGPAGRLDADITYSEWLPPDPAPASPSAASASATSAPAPAAPLLFPRQISIRRPQQDYQLAISILKVSLNTEAPPDRFELAQPPGSQLVQLDQQQNQGADSQKAQP